MRNFVVNHCKGCSCTWKLPQESQKALEEIIACPRKRCPFNKEDAYEWYWTLTGNLGADIPAYPEDVHEGLPVPIQGLNHVDQYKAKT